MSTEDLYHTAYKCLDCGTILMSLKVHQFVKCECFDHEKGSGCFVDGGYDYTRVGGDPDRVEAMKIKIRNEA